MKKAILLVATTMLMFLWPGNPSTARHQPEKGTSAGFFYYTWYYDEEMANPVGAVSTINTELEYLRMTFSGNVFSSSPSLGLSPFEYGSYSYYPTAIIYSDLSWQLNRSRDSAATRR